MLRHPNPSEQGLRGRDDHSRRVPGTEPPSEGPGPQGRRGSRETDARLRGSVRQEEPRGLRRERPLGSHRRGRRRRGRREPHGPGEGVLGVARGPRAPPGPRREEDILVRPGARRVPREREASPGEEVHERVPGFAQGEPRRDGVPVEAHRADRGSPGGRPRLPRQDHRHDPQEDTLQQRRVLLRDPETRGLRRGHVFSGEGLGGVRSPERGVEGRGVPAGVPGRLRNRGDRSLRAQVPGEGDGRGDGG